MNSIPFNDTLFRQQFPAFADTVKYPTAILNVFWNVAANFIDSVDFPCRILTGDSLVYALNCLTAHLYTLSLQQQEAAIGQGGAGSVDQGGFITSAHIDEITVSKMAPPASNGWQYWLSTTPYGQALWALLSVISVGGTSVGGLPEREGFRKVGGVFW